MSQESFHKIIRMLIKQIEYVSDYYSININNWVNIIIFTITCYFYVIIKVLFIMIL